MIRLFIFATLALMTAFAALWLVAGGVQGPAHGAASPTITVLCAAGLRGSVERAAKRFTESTGVTVRFQFGGSGHLLGSVIAGAPADIFLTADSSYVDIAADKGLVREQIALATQYPAIALHSDHRGTITGLDDLIRSGRRFAIPNPEAASLGRSLQQGLGATWDSLVSAAAVSKPTVPDLLADLQVGSVDAALIWKPNVSQVPGLIAVEDPALTRIVETITAGVTSNAREPRAALAFLRWLTSPEHGAAVWSQAGYLPLTGDRWAEQPELTLYCGAVNRLAIQGALSAFAEREGVQLKTVFNGCGILCADMSQAAKSGGVVPDIYYACDLCYVAPVAELFPEAVLLTEADIVIAVPRGNPQRIIGLADLARPEVVLGICNAEQSTLGFMTKRMLQNAGMEKSVMASVRSQVPTADLLINQLRTGALTAAIVYEVNMRPQAAHLESLALKIPGAVAVQPFAVRRDSPYRGIAGRLLDHLRTRRADFESAGFRWRGDSPTIDSRTIDPDPVRRALAAESSPAP